MRGEALAGSAPPAWLAGPGRRRRGRAGDRALSGPHQGYPERTGGSAARPVPVVDGVPTYYAGLAKTSDVQTSPEQIVVGDTVTGKRLATVAPPAGTTFAGITGAADDRTFVVDTQPGSLDPESEPWQPRTWYLLGSIRSGAPGPADAAAHPRHRRWHQCAGRSRSPRWHRARCRTAAGRPERPERADLPAGLLGRERGRAALWFATAACDGSGQPQFFAGTKYGARTATSRSPGWVSAGSRSATAGS